MALAVRLNNLAWILSAYTDRAFHNPARAVKLAEKARQLTAYQNPEMLDTLSVCYAAVGRFDDAAKIADTALKLATAAGNNKLATHLQKQLQKYRQTRTAKFEQKGFDNSG